METSRGTRNGGDSAGAERRKGPRTPRQARGQERVDAILDAAADLIVESGVGALTVAGIAERACTSIGSMYHFFPSLEAVLTGLADRHIAALQDLRDRLGSRNESEWSALSSREAVEEVLAPIEAYLADNPHVFQLSQDPRVAALMRGPEMKVGGLQLVDRMLSAHVPHLDPEHRHAAATVILGTIEGVLTLASNLPTPHPPSLREATRQALTAYVHSLTPDG